jgi:cytochrome o ubiquinol oxidase subunit II
MRPSSPGTMISRRSCLAIATLPLLAGGCDLVVMNPAGDVARQQANLILWSTGLMLLIIVPVMVLTVLFAWRYRQGNDRADYEPDWDHSTGLELVIWSAPLLIIIALGALTWVATHTLDPYRPLGRIAKNKAVPANDRPLEVQVVSLDWKWLFIYPEQGIATVNELVLPVDRQVRFRLTSSSVMNTFYVPAMAGMIYTMPGMETKLHAVLNRSGRFEGMSANYSGAGFSGMRFWTYATDRAGFDRWAADARRAPLALTADNYLKLQRPSEKVRPIRFGSVAPDLYRRALEMCVRPGTTCMSESMHRGGTHPPVNDRPAQPGEPKGALRQQPEEFRESPHLTKPRGPAKGPQQPGAEANRNMTLLDRPPLPDASAAASARG